MGWLVLFPNAPMHHYAYGIEMAFLCDCEVPVVGTRADGSSEWMCWAARPAPAASW